jgi:hypothetical protein
MISLGKESADPFLCSFETLLEGGAQQKGLQSPLDLHLELFISGHSFPAVVERFLVEPDGPLLFAIVFGLQGLAVLLEEVGGLPAAEERQGEQKKAGGRTGDLQ